MQKIVGVGRKPQDELGGETAERLVVLGIAARGAACHVALVDVTESLNGISRSIFAPRTEVLSGEQCRRRKTVLQRQSPGYDTGSGDRQSSQREPNGDASGLPSVTPSQPQCHEICGSLLQWTDIDEPFWLDEGQEARMENSQGVTCSDTVSISVVSSPSPHLHAAPQECSSDAEHSRTKRSCSDNRSCSSTLSATKVSEVSPLPRVSNETKGPGAIENELVALDQRRNAYSLERRTRDEIQEQVTTSDWHSEASDDGWLSPITATKQVTPARDDADLILHDLDLFMEQYLGEPLTMVIDPRPETAASPSRLRKASCAPENVAGTQSYPALRNKDSQQDGIPLVAEESLIRPAIPTSPARQPSACRFLAQFTETAVTLNVQHLGRGHRACELLVQHVEIMLLEAYALANMYQTRCQQMRANPNSAGPASTEDVDALGQGPGMQTRTTPTHNDAWMRSYQRRLSDLVKCCVLAGERERERLEHDCDGPLDSDLDELEDAIDLEAVLRQVALCCGRKSRRRQTSARRYRLVGLGVTIDGLSATADQKALAERLEWRFHCPTAVLCWDDLTLPLIRATRPSPISILAGASSNQLSQMCPLEPSGPWQGAALMLLSSERGCLCRLVAKLPEREDQGPSRADNAAGCLDIRIGGYGPLLGDEGSPFVLGLDALRYMLSALDGMNLCCSDNQWAPSMSRAAAEALLHQALKHFECADLEALLRHIYHTPLRRCEMVDFGYLVAELAGPSPQAPQGNCIAAMALHRAGHALGRHLAAAFGQAWSTLPTDAAPSGIPPAVRGEIDVLPTRPVPVVCVGHLFSFLGHSVALADGLRAGWRTNRASALRWLHLQLHRYKSRPRTSSTDPADVMTVLVACDRCGVPGSATQAFLEEAAPQTHLEPVLLLE